jgi:hypothetical protein
MPYRMMTAQVGQEVGTGRRRGLRQGAKGVGLETVLNHTEGD